jgi:3-oxoacyl-[acyl-carrier-protein] synthase-3
VTNEALAADLGIDPAAIAGATGVTVRHVVTPGLGPSDLGCEASRVALERAGLQATDVDLIVFTTMTPDLAFPGSGCFLQDKLGCDTVGAVDVRGQCAGFLFGVATASRFIEAGASERALVVGAEVHSTALDRNPRAATVTPRFGDGAGAVVLGRRDAGGILATVLHTDPTHFERFWCEYPSSRHYPARMEIEHYERGQHFYVLDAPALDREAEPTLASTIAEVAGRAGIGVGDVDLWIVHYLDPRVARRAAAAAGVSDARVVAPAETIGHVAGAGIPWALGDAMDSGRIGPGAVVGCVAFGAGISWGGMMVRL